MRTIKRVNMGELHFAPPFTNTLYLHSGHPVFFIPDTLYFLFYLESGIEGGAKCNFPVNMLRLRSHRYDNTRKWRKTHIYWDFFCTVYGYFLRSELTEELNLTVIKDKNLDYLSSPSIEDLPHIVSRLYPHRQYLYPQYRHCQYLHPQ